MNEKKRIIKRSSLIITIIGLFVGVVISAFGIYNFIDISKEKVELNTEDISGGSYYVQPASFGADYYTYTYNAAKETVDALSGLNYKAEIINDTIIQGLNQSIATNQKINVSIYALISSIGLFMSCIFMFLFSKCIKKNPNYRKYENEDISSNIAKDDTIESSIV